jgi:hypothetical protein
MTHKSILQLTPAQKSVGLGDPSPAKGVTGTAGGPSAIRCFDRDRPAAVKIGPLVSTVAWRSVKDELPDDTITCLVACAGEADSEQGYRCAGRWLYGDGYTAKRVYAWAHMPATPRAGRGKKGGAA